MGLDMYLTRRWYVKNWEYFQQDERHAITVMRGGKPSIIPVDRISYIETEEMVWRKANQIHHWFVINVQDGNDDCGTYDVTVEHIKTLLDLVKQVLADHDKAEKLLPSQSGFFFGSTDYDEWYFSDLEMTKTGLEKVLSSQSTQTEEMSYLQYHSSW